MSKRGDPARGGRIPGLGCSGFDFPGHARKWKEKEGARQEEIEISARTRRLGNVDRRGKIEVKLLFFSFFFFSCVAPQKEVDR